jgi:hypothetical protein
MNFPNSAGGVGKHGAAQVGKPPAGKAHDDAHLAAEDRLASTSHARSQEGRP